MQRPLPRRGVEIVRRIGMVLLLAWIGLNALLILRDAAIATF